MKQEMFCVLFFFSVILFTSQILGQNGKVVNLPDAPSNLADMYAGYIKVGSRNYFFWLIESARNPASDPIILWLNGGPGCSSLGGLLSENGPFNPNPSGKLDPNPYSWNKFANVLYLESPAGVGFSYCDSNCPTFTDNSTASDNYNFLVTFFNQYPKYAKNDFYISGESYAGHYIPTLVYNIYVNKNSNPNAPPQSNFKGFAAGNPLTDGSYDFGNGIQLFYQTHGMLPLSVTGHPTGQYNHYDILVDICHSEKMKKYIRFPHPFIKPEHEESKKRLVPNPYPCIDDYVETYLNRNEVKQAIHAKSSIRWEDCGNIPYSFGTQSMLPYYKIFMDSTNWKILVYSGDADTVLNFISTEQWINDLKRPVKVPWRNWNYVGDFGSQIGGWGFSYDRLTFKTVKGAGHMVPWFEPAASLQLLSDFINNSDE